MLFGARYRRIKIIVIMALFITTIMPTIAKGAAVKLNDIGDSYAKQEIQALVDEGIVSGYEDRSFGPRKAMTRAEPAKIYTESLKVTEATAKRNTLVEVTFNQYVSALESMDFTFDKGLIVTNVELSSGNKKQVRLTTNAQNAGTVYKLSYKGMDTGISVTGISAAGDKGSGDDSVPSTPPGSHPATTDILNRGGVYSGDLNLADSGEFGPASGTTTVTGTLTLDPGPTGEITLQNIVADNIEVRSGSSGSIRLKDVSIKAALKINASGQLNPVRIVTQGTTDVKKTEVYSKAVLESPEGQGSLGEVEIIITETDQTVELRGTYTGGVTVAEGTADTSIKLSAGVTLKKLKLDANVKLEGDEYAILDLPLEMEENIRIDVADSIKALLKQKAVENANRFINALPDGWDKIETHTRDLTVKVLIALAKAYAAKALGAADDEITNFNKLVLIGQLITAKHTIYVAPTGSDGTGNGSAQAPYLTLQAARETARTLITEDMSSNITVVLREGIYKLDQTLELGPNDSGRNGYDVVYRAYPGEKPVLSGGDVITGWTLDSPGVYKAPVGDLEFRQLYVNDTRAIRARTPDAGVFFRVQTWDNTNKKLNVLPEDVSAIDDQASPIELIVQTMWSDQHLRVQSIDVNGSTASIKPVSAEGNIVFARGAPKRDNKASYHMENSMQFMDSAGEFYLDQTSGLVYYRPRANEIMDSAQVVAPRLETLIRLSGTIDEPVKHIRFEGISFEHAGWNEPTHSGYVPTQANFSSEQSYKLVPAAISVQYARNLQFERNQFRHLGGNGVDLYQGTADVELIGNVFADISGNGINMDSTLVKYQSDPRSIVKRTRVANNFITQIGQDYYGAVGIFAGYTEDLTIEHNEIFDLPYSAISVGWGWTRAQTALKNNVVRYNDIYDVLNLLVDGAAIYTLSNQPNSSIHDNFVHDMARSPWSSADTSFQTVGIYLDQGTEGYKVENNVLLKVPTKIFSGNTIFGTNTFYGNYGDSIAVKQGAGLEPPYKDIRFTNLDYDPLATVLVDQALPTLTGAVSDEGGSYIDLLFNEAIDPYSIDASKFILHGTEAKVATASLDTRYPKSTNVRLNLEGNLQYNETITLSLTAGAVRDGALNEILAVDRAVPNNVLNPYRINVEMDGTTILNVGESATVSPYLITLDGQRVTPGPGVWQYTPADPSKLTINAATGQITATVTGDTYVTISTMLNEIAVTTKLDVYIIAAGMTKPAVVNIANKKETTFTGKSSGSAYGAAKAVDNNVNTFWSIDNAGSLTVDLGDLYQLYNIRRIEVVMRQDVNHSVTRKNFAIQASNHKDFAAPVILGSQGDTAIAFQGTWPLELTGKQTYRYIRFSKPKDFATVAELRVWAEFDSSSKGAPVWSGESKLEAAQGTRGQVELKWPTQPDMTAYKVFVDGREPVIIPASVTGNVYTATTISNWPEGIALAAKVEAKNAAGIWSTNGPYVTYTANWSFYHINLTVEGSQILKVGEGTLLHPVLADRNEQPLSNPAWQFESDDPSIATVNAQTGFIQAVGAGKTQVGMKVLYDDGGIYTRDIDIYVFAQADPEPNLVNYALNQPATKEGILAGTNYGPEKAVDGRTDNLFATNGKGSLTVDLGEFYNMYHVRRIEAVMRQDGNNYTSERKNFEVLGSNDPNFSTSTILGSQGDEAVPNLGTWTQEVTDAQSYRYIRYNRPTGSATLAEFRVFVERATSGIALEAPTWPDGSVLTAVQEEYGHVRVQWPVLPDSTAYKLLLNGQENITVTGNVYTATIANWAEGVAVTAKVEARNAAGLWSTNGPSVAYTANWTNYHVNLTMGGSPILTVGETATLLPVLADHTGQAVNWGSTVWQFESTNPAVASVNAQTGVVQAVYGGAASVRITGLHDAGTFTTVLDVFVYAQGQTKPATVNIAKSKPSEYAGILGGSNYGPEKALDGNINTIWNIKGKGSMTVDLGESYNWYDIRRIEVVMRQDAANYSVERKNFEIQASNNSDFATYTILGSQGADAVPYKGTWSVDLTVPQSYRYIRFSKSVDAATIAELRVLAAPRS